jgi:cytochrome c peroxidase
MPSVIRVILLLLISLITKDTYSQNVDSQKAKKLGEKLFSERALSFNRTKSCASCHNPTLFFSDGYRTSVGAKGDILKKNSPSLLNARFRSKNLSSDVLRPLITKTPIELGTASSWEVVKRRLQRIPYYRRALRSLYQDISLSSIVFPLTVYVSTLQAEYPAIAVNSIYESNCVGCHPLVKSSLNPLYNVRFTAPFLRDGSATTLKDAVTSHNSTLKPSELTSILRFLYKLSD